MSGEEDVREQPPTETIRTAVLPSTPGLAKPLTRAQKALEVPEKVDKPRRHRKPRPRTPRRIYDDKIARLKYIQELFITVFLAGATSGALYLIYLVAQIVEAFTRDIT